MFSSFKGRIIFFIFLILACTTALIMYFTYRDVGRAITGLMEDSVRNIYQLVELNVEGDYKQFQQEKLSNISRRKKELKQSGQSIFSVIKEYGKMADQGIIQKSFAKENALEWFKSYNSIHPESTCFVMNSDGTILSHPDSEFAGTSLSDLKDIKGRNIVTSALDKRGEPGGYHAVFKWNRNGGEAGPKILGFFMPCSRWNWIIASTVEIGDMEAEIQNKLDRMIDVLDSTFSKLTIAGAGSAFLFNEDKEILIPPRIHENMNLETAVNSLTGNRLMADYIRTSHSDKSTFRYALQSDPGSREMVTTVKYFKLLDWHIALTVPVKAIQRPAGTIVTHQLLLISGIFIVSLVLTYFLVGRITKPLNILSSYAKEIPFLDLTSEDPSESPIKELPDRYKDETGRLAESIMYMKTELSRNIRKLMETTAEKEAIEAELNIARKIQMGILPKIFPPFPDHTQFDLYASLKPAREVGGDLYDFFFIDEDHLCFTVGDVSDKGVPAALFMVITKTLLKTIAMENKNPAETMTKLNDVLCSENPNNMFITLFVGILNIRTGEIRYANGGHNPPIVIDKEAPFFRKEISGPVVGVMEKMEYKELALALEPEDTIFIYTDGVTEAKDINENLFSDKRLLDEVTELDRNCSVKSRVNKILDELESYAGDAPQWDDIAMMMIQYHG